MSNCMYSTDFTEPKVIILLMVMCNDVYQIMHDNINLITVKTTNSECKMLASYL